MAWSQCSNSTYRGGRFYEECESASENFLYRGRQPRREERSHWTPNLKPHADSLFSSLRTAFLCCFGTRNEGPARISDLGLDIPRLFGSARTQFTSVSDLDDFALKHDQSKFLWVTQSNRWNSRAPLTFNAARWVALSWIARILNGEKMNRKMLDSLVTDASGEKNSLDTISESVIKGFPGLHLAQNIKSSETSDHVIAIDTIIESLDEHYSINQVSSNILMNQDTSCCAIYFNNRGYSRDIVLLEINTKDKRQALRCMAFHRIEDMREYLLNLDSLKGLSVIFYHSFTVKCPQRNVIDSNIECLTLASPEEANSQKNIIELESEDPRKDAKVVFSHAKQVVNM